MPREGPDHSKEAIAHRRKRRSSCPDRVGRFAGRSSSQ
jgi:hypothetical protein